MKIPKKLKVGGITFSVKIAEDWFERNGCDGETFYDKKRGNIIYIGSELSQEAQEICLIHEALHCMNTTMNHEFLDSLSEQIYQMFKDNKLLK